MTGPSDARAAVRTVWQRQSVWSQAAGQAKRRIERSRVWFLGLTIAAAILGTASAQVNRHLPDAAKALAAAAAVALAVAPLVARGARRDAVQAWIRMRSVAESLKADAYRYLAGTTPFDGADRDTVLLDRLDERVADADDLVGYTTTIEPVVRDLPLVCDVGSYLTHRVDAQISGYYRPAARRMATRGARIRWLTVALSGTAAALTAVVGVVGGSALTAWIGVVTTVTTALTGYGAAQRYEYQQLEFTRTANQLERLRTGRLGERSQLDDDAFVSECERIISISNEGWMAKVADENPT